MNVWHVGTLACAVISLLLLFIGMASDHWMTDISSHRGLWRVCSLLRCCTYISVRAYLHATRAFLVIGVIVGALACFALGALFSRPKIASYSLSMVAVIASFAASISILIAMAIFTGVTDSDHSYGWSFGLGWVSFPLFIITGALAYKLHSQQ
ncbi:lens fiber membrane intrinsic protein-like [Hemicordylus capensis]|uniref:lens fiber membrane intrinsic protein-like n=1 Tax=Hemicordylus capensis TaxID=884348 RepID=UPI0023041BB3|nr:lens fiber membrane intrinsic protein-like [Hemicordylus capensis]XP_053122818.1 lens fiber membrane intrinsic protein-like [Hemicordylus capensis]XP_053122819.1 lens fiber membrane intrinsic protein-like [Hemicordylus capensis]